MLPKIHRLTKKKDFEAVFRKGILIKSDIVLLRAVKNHLPESRFGFVVSKKVSSKATIRNKVKRRLRKAVQDQLLKVKNPMDAIIISLPGVEKKEFSEIQEIIATMVKKLT